MQSTEEKRHAGDLCRLRAQSTRGRVARGASGIPRALELLHRLRPKGGFIGTLTPLTAEDASLAVGGTSIAAHVHHVAWGMDATAAWIRGDREGRDWKESWKIMTGDREAWTHLVGELRGQYDQLRQTIHSHALDGDESFGGAVAAIAHLAYHLGAVRQKIALLHQR